MSKLVTLTELAQHIGRPKRTLYRMIQDGRFPVEPVQGTHPRLWNIEHVNKWMEVQ